jgi:transcriptional regulator with XRE-family HTH domain
MNITAKRLRELREAKKMSQGDIAKILGISRTAYVKYETGESRPVRKLNELSTLFGVSSDYLLGISDSPLSENPNPNNKHPAFTDDEYKLLSNYRKLNHVGKVAAQGSVEALTLQKQFCTKIKTGEAT